MSREALPKDGPGHLCVRADASSRIGTGHIMRCLALGQAWRDRGGEVTFLGSRESAVLRDRVAGEGFQWVTIPEPHPASVDLETTLPALARLCKSRGRWVVLDGYHFDEGYQRALRAAGHRLLLIDDIGHLSRYHADILLNQNSSREMVSYRADPETRFLLGHRYVLLRREFLNRAGEEREHADAAGNILVTLGGADPENVTLMVVEALKRLGRADLSVRVVAGASNPHKESLERSASSAVFDCRLMDATERMPELMAWADMAVSAGGSTCWEMAFMGLPNLVIVLAENQKAVTGVLHSAGCSVIPEEPPDMERLCSELDALIGDRGSRERMSDKGRLLIDGLGSRRVVDAILDDL